MEPVIITDQTLAASLIRDPIEEVVAGGPSGLPLQFPGTAFVSPTAGLSLSEAMPGTTEFESYVGINKASDGNNKSGSFLVATKAGGGLPNYTEYEAPGVEDPPFEYATMEFVIGGDPWSIEDGKWTIKRDTDEEIVIRVDTPVLITPTAPGATWIFFVDTTGYLYLSYRVGDAVQADMISEPSYEWAAALARGPR